MESETFNFDPDSYAGLDRLGRVPLSTSFHMREFLYSEIAIHHGLRNVPDRDRIEYAVHAGRQLCMQLLEPLQSAFGRLHIRSGYRSKGVNAAGVGRHNCAADNDGLHTWDYPSTNGHGAGATACISIPRVSAEVLSGHVHELSLAWWIYDHLPTWSCMEFFSTPEHSNEVAFNIGWHEKPMKEISNWRGGPRAVHKQIPSEPERKEAWLLLTRACAASSIAFAENANV